MITDSLMTPTYIDDIANGLKYLFNNYKPETYHMVGNQSISPLRLRYLWQKLLISIRN